uniref:Uncharacterized protein n=1 Tax=Ditylenchus dipsaci TaxID=166011 RepID=A0A915EL81_9BILA
MGARQEPHYIGGERISCHQKLHQGLEKEEPELMRLSCILLLKRWRKTASTTTKGGISEDEEEVVLENVNENEELYFN